MNRARDEASNNKLLSSLVKALNSKEDLSQKKLKKLIVEADNEQLIRTFHFLQFWISSRRQFDNDSIKEKAFSLFSLLLSNIPPANLFEGYMQFNIDNSQSSLLLQDTFSSYMKRLYHISNLALECFAENIFSDVKINIDFHFVKKMMQGIKIDFLMKSIEGQPMFIESFKAQVKTLIMDNWPLPSIKRMDFFKGFKLILTDALIEMIKSANFSNSSSNVELVSTFSKLFTYIYAFTTVNIIDLQILCDAMLNFWCYSPFLILEMVCNIPKFSPMYHIIFPQELGKNISNKQEALNILKCRFPIIDLSNINDVNNPEADVLNEIKKPEIIYDILYYYMVPSIVHDPKADFKNEHLTNYDITVNLHLSNSSLFSRCLKILNFLKTGKLNDIEIKIMNYGVLHFFLVQLFKNSNEKIKANPVLNASVSNLKMKILSLIAPMPLEKLLSTFFANPEDEDGIINNLEKIYELLNEISRTPNDLLSNRSSVNPILMYCLTIVSNHKKIREKVPPQPAGSGAESDLISNSFNTARYIIGKILFSVDLKITEKIEEMILNSDDIDLPTIIFFISAFEDVKSTIFYYEYITIHQIKEKLIDHIPFNILSKSPLEYEITINKEKLKFLNEPSKEYVNRIESKLKSDFAYVENELQFKGPNKKTAKSKYKGSIWNKARNDIGLFIILLYLKLQDKHYLKFINKTFLPQSHIQPMILLYGTRRFLSFLDLNSNFSNMIFKFIEIIIHQYNNNLITFNELKIIFFYCYHKFKENNILSQFYNSITNKDSYKTVFEGKVFITLKMTDIINYIYNYRNSFKYRYEELKSIIIICILIKRNNNDDIINFLFEPIKAFQYHSSDREGEGKEIVSIAANMPNDISFGFFLKLTELPISNLVISMSKYMLKRVNFDVLCRVCTYFHNSAGNDNETTTILIKSLIPNSIRFYGSDKHFENFLKALIKSIPEGSSLEKQEEILDIILMTNRYFLNPQNEKLREDLIATMNANKATLPRIRSALATNFMK